MGRSRPRGICLVLGLLLLLPWLAAAAPRPLSAEGRRAVESVPDEKPYDVRIHFLTSNERRHDVFYPLLRGLGGAYVGVASDQNYTLAAAAGAELVWLIDIDAHVIQWHRIYAALLPAAPTAADLAALLDGKHGEAVSAALRARWPEAEAQQLLAAFRRDRARISAHVRRELQQYRGGQPLSWLSDPALYAHVRWLAQERRIVPRVGDLHGDGALVAIGAAARAAGLPVRVFYISNVEQWFRYSPQLVRNLSALPRDGRSLILRTIARHELRAPAGDRWHFSVEKLDDFLAQVSAATPLRRVQDLIPEMGRAERSGGTQGLSLLGSLQPPAQGLAQRERHVVALRRPTPPLRGPEVWALPRILPPVLRPRLAAASLRGGMRVSWATVVVPF